MELTESKVKYLLNEENLNKLSSDTFDQLMTIAISQTSGNYNSDALSHLLGSKPDLIKAAYADISKLLIEAARLNTSSEDLCNLLRCTTLTKPYVDKFSEYYENCKAQVQENLESIGNSLPHIIDVDWSLDYCIKSSINSSSGFPLYNVSLSTMKHGTIEKIKFTCTIQQLEEIVYKLKDAVRHSEKLANP